ncbi:hypothetical protein AU512_02855 [Lonsdalea iberica]|uniref:YqcI/YcgG family protein n=1 Tax=Lonsdalea iberica TaxID=1082703 RepID=A0ABX3XJB3_9GAMM|nr:YqcI/YcgG family protein [Lonsdalea iberica]OSN11426.1 hypothetical protein AU512_02855 [Lonsdalea iberica]
MKKTSLRSGTIIGQSDLMRLSRDTGKVCPIKEWQIDGFRDIAARLNDRAFPCLFARHAWKSKTLLFGLISEGNTANDMLTVMRRFTERTQKVPEEERLYSPLVLIFERAGLDSLEEAQRFAWQQLQSLHDYDTHAWPEHIPDDPGETAWSFCFAGIELFFNVSCPGHSQLRSRNLGKRAVFIVNPRAHFDILASQKDPKGIKIREKIRTRVCDYNNGYVPSELGFYGQETSLEWKQYLLSEPGAPNLTRCPLHIHKDKYLK